MKTINKQICPKVLALAIAAAFAPTTYAADVPDEVAEYTQPSSSVSAGLGIVSGDKKDRSIFGQYSGMRTEDAYGLFDLDLVRRDDATGTWMILRGNNLGLDNRDLSATYERQGNWKITGSYNEITHRELRTINTGDTGVGSTTPHAILLGTPGTGSDVDLKLQRKGLGLGGEKWITPKLMLEINFKNEDKDGARFTGKGYDCASSVCASGTATAGKTALLMQAEPVNFNTKQLDIRLNYAGDQLHVNGGYYGSFFKNENGSVNMTVDPVMKNGNGTGTAALYGPTSATLIAGGGTSLQNVLQLPFALPPDNQAHQFYVDGNYGFTKTTKATFKYAYTHATQHESFMGTGLTGAPGGVGDLGGELNTTLLQLGITAKPIPKLSLSGNVRYEKREDKTPQYLYNVEARGVNPAGSLGTFTFTNTNQPGVTPGTWYNGLTSSKKLAGKIEAGYQLTTSYRATLGVDYDKIEREVPTSIVEDVVAGLSALRAKTEETGYRAELSRVMSDTLTGSISYTNSRRRGSDWTTLSTLNPATPGVTAAQLALINAYCGGTLCYGQQLPASSILGLSATSAFPMSMADLNREKWKLNVNWNPTEKLSLQFVAEDGEDKNVTASDPIAGGKGYRKNKSNLYSVDAAYSITDNWQLTGYASHGKQTLAVNHSTGYLADLNDRSDAIGLGLKGHVTGRLEIGAGIDYIKDVTKYGIAASPSATGAAPTAANLQQAAIGLPDVEFNQTVFNLFGVYGLDKKSDVRVDLVHQRAKLKEWSWGNNGVPFVYADNTTVSLQETQNVTFVGARYIYKFK